MRLEGECFREGREFEGIDKRWERRRRKRGGVRIDKG